MSIIRENVWIHYLGFPKDVKQLPNGKIIFTEGPVSDSDGSVMQCMCMFLLR